MPMVTQLTFDLDEAGAQALEAAVMGEAAPEQSLSTLHFDTLDLALRQAGLSLFIQQAQGVRVQMLHGLPDAESPLESVVQGDLPVLDSPLKALLDLDHDRLQQLFRIQTRRRTSQVATKAGPVDLVLDRATVTAADRQAGFCQLGLTLGAGATPQALYALARRLDAIAPLRPAGLAPAERGHLLLDQMPLSFKAEPVALQPKMPTGQALRQIAFSCLRQYRLNEELLLQADRPEAVHQARVALRRLRSAFSIFRGLTQAPEARALRNELRWLAAVLGAARDLDVLAERATPDLAIHDHLTQARMEAYAQLRQTLAAPRVRALMLALGQWLNMGDWLTAPECQAARDMPLRDFASTALARQRRKLRKDGHNLSRLQDEARHEVRKDAKKLRYTVDFFSMLYPKKKSVRRYGLFLKALERLQDRLGLLNDLAATPELLQRLGIADHPDAPILLGHASRKPLIRRADKAMQDMERAGKFWP